MPVRTTANPGNDQARIERAWRAVRRAREMEPMLTSFVRMLSGRDDMRVQIDSNATRTDGTIVYLLPPMELGDNWEHDRLVCGVRHPDTRKYECQACAAQDAVFARIFHEVAHEVFDSFSRVSQQHRVRMLDLMLQEFPALAGTRYAKLREKYDSYVRSKPDLNYAEAANLISPYLHPIINAIEDSRVNRAMYEVRNGTRDMFHALAVEVFENGMEMPTGETLLWSELEPEAQVLVGLYAKTSDFDYSQWFAPEVIEVLDDPVLSRLLDRADRIKNMGGVFNLAFPVLERLRELGYCRLPDDPEDDPPEPPEAPPVQGGEEDEDSDGSSDDSSDQGGGEGSSEDDDEKSDGDDDADGEGEDDDEADAGGRGESDSADDADEGDDESDGSNGSQDGDERDDESDTQDGGGDTQDDDESQDDGDGDGDGQPQDPAMTAQRALEAVRQFGGHGDTQESHEEFQEREHNQEALTVAVEQSEHFDAPSRSVAKVEVYSQDQSPRGYGNTPTVESLTPPPALINGALQRARVVFADNRRAAQVQNQRHGRVVSTRLVTVPTGNRKVFSRTLKHAKKDYAVGLSLDISGSTEMALRLNRNVERITLIRELGFTVGELLSRLGIDFYICGHSGDWHPSGMDQVSIFSVKGINDPWDMKAKQALSRLRPTGYNLDGHTFEYHRKQITRFTATDRLLIYVTDGDMPDSNFTEELEVLQRELKTLKQKRIEVLGVGVQTDSPKQYGLETIQMNSVNDLQQLVKALEKRFVTPSI